MIVPETEEPLRDVSGEKYSSDTTAMDMPSDLGELRINRQTPKALHVQIYYLIREAIIAGKIRLGTKVPVAKAFAHQLGAPHAAMLYAYRRLAVEGYINEWVVGEYRFSKPERLEPPQEAGLHKDTNVYDRARQAVQSSSLVAAPSLPFRLDIPALDAFPADLWSRLLARHARTPSIEHLVTQDPCGYLPLREAIANHLANTRGIFCFSDQVVITTGFEGALGLLSRVLLTVGDRVWVEDPGDLKSKEALALAGAELVPIRIDRHGLDVSAAINRVAEARVALVTPTPQHPLGVLLSLRRRSLLLAWAKQLHAWIIECDHGFEFCQPAVRFPPLMSFDDAGRVFYVGDFAATLFPGIGIGFVVVPIAAADSFRRAVRYLSGQGSLLAQMTLAAFITEGHMVKHVNRLRRLYTQRRGALFQALSETFGNMVEVDERTEGLHLVARFRTAESDVTLAARARAYDLFPEPLSRTALETDCGQALLLGFTNIPPQSALETVRRLCEAIAL